MKTQRTRMFGVLLAFAVAGAAFGQVRQLETGRTMDANPQTGTGGSNQPVRGYVPINGNEVMSGNVAGLKYFHGSSIPNSQNEFQGRLGTSQLQNFARQSASGSGLGQVYYLPSATVSTGQGGLYSSPLTGGFDSTLVPRTAVSPIASEGQIRRLEGQGGSSSYAVERAMPAPPLVAGTPGALMTSPVFALRLPAQRVGENTEKSGEKSQDEKVEAKEQKRPGAVDGAVDAQQTGELQGAQLNPKERPPEDLRISGVYRGLMQDLEKSAEKAERGPKEGGGLGAAALAEQEKAQAAAKDIDPLTGMPRKIKAIKPTMPGMGEEDPLGPKDSLSAKGPMADKARETKGKTAMSSKRLEDMPVGALRAGSNLAPLKTFVQTKEGVMAPVDVLMGRAEGALKEGKYLEAAQGYQLALETEPANTLALIGRAHAELGAGMYQSAAYDLKFAFTRNPQMIGVKYTTDTFLNAKRDDFLVKDLTTLTNSKEMSDTGSFLLCYLHYQGGRQEQLKSELSRWGARAEHDKWQEVLNRAWNPDYAGLAPGK